MELGICDYSVGRHGSPCKHQYISWKIHLKSTNFIPYLSHEERKQCSYIAIGEVLPDTYYAGLHDYLTDNIVNDVQHPDQNTER